MRGTRAAKRYAKAILSLAKDKNSATKVQEDMLSILRTVEGSKELSDMLGSPVIKNSLKKKSLSAIFPNLNELTQGSVDLLIENGRLEILDAVARQYIYMYNEDNQLKEAIVTTAIPLDKELEKVIMTKVKELTGTEAKLKQIVDESIIGGFILRIGDLQYDASVSRSLNNLKRRFKENTYVSKI
ncbi:ATP synthase F1 subunit delta [Christiangramia fulva]|uniref:ATP synthase subunit delta n=1 Tax=Christiangramia fulva TaxID=2126553 RepID=A0A2R3Z3N6_9FLAO|nr:ATP synthase F1 subunit delta [Christiangramia fulva]AVR44869.1 ATP synthase F1 subunit delta [Christiangramia fulva]